MASFKQMRLDGMTKRAEAAKIDLNDIHFDPAFNAVGRNEEHDEDDEELYQFIIAGGLAQLPEWEVIPRDEGGVTVVEGHRRTIQVRRAVAEGKLLPDEDGKVWIPIKQFVGNDVDRIARIGTSNKKKGLKPHQFAELCKRLRGFNLSAATIAEKMCCSRPKVDQALMLADANHDVQEAVQTGVISATEAIKQVRKHGEKAGAVIKEAAATVAPKESKGKPATKPKKVTAKTLAPKPDGKLELPKDSMVDRVIALSKALKGVCDKLAPYVENNANMHIDDIRALYTSVEAVLHEGRKK